jgi:ribosomal-protein-alanine N-acetyltransferase
MHYRPYLPADFPQLYAIEEACFQPPMRFGRRYMRQLVTSPNAVTWVAEEAGELAGFAIVEWSGAPAEIAAYIQTLEVSHEHRRQGIGLELLRRIESSARAAGAAQIWLHVDKENTAALRLYHAEGYVQRGTHAHYYGRTRDAHIYCKQL